MFFGAAVLELPMFPDNVLLDVAPLGGASCSGDRFLPLLAVCTLSDAMTGLENDGMASSSNSSSSSTEKMSFSGLVK